MDNFQKAFSLFLDYGSILQVYSSYTEWVKSQLNPPSFVPNPTNFVKHTSRQPGLDGW